MKRLALAGLGFVLALAASAPPVGAQTVGGGELGPDSVRATASDLGAGTFPGPGLPAVAPSVESAYTWERTTTASRCVVFGGPIPPELVGSVTPLPGITAFPYSPVQVGTLQGAPAGALKLDGGAPLPAGAVLAGTFVVDTATPRDGGPGVFLVPRCTAPGEPLPPAPPSAAAIWRQTPLPRAHVHASPPGTRDWPGIVNLESRFWGDALPDARATVTLDGYVVDVAAHPVAYGWVFDDGTTSVGATPGDATAPLATTFRRRGDHDLALYVTWAGLAHVTAPAFGLDFGMQYLGTVTLAVTQTHHVAEIRALLRSRTARG
jgi:hypothetical protein